MLTTYPDDAFIADWNDRPPTRAPIRPRYQQRALLIWPGLDRARLRRTDGDPWRIARLVESRTGLTMEDILVLLMGPDLGNHDPIASTTAHAPPAI